MSGKLLGSGSIYRDSSLYPQCKIFSCPKARYITNKCCFYCQKKDKCNERCLNDPAKCRMCVIPPKMEKEMHRINDFDLPDAPDIARAERTGLRPGEVPFDDDENGIICPICGKMCETFYFDRDGDLFGCDMCVKRTDAYQYEVEEGKQND